MESELNSHPLVYHSADPCHSVPFLNTLSLTAPSRAAATEHARVNSYMVETSDTAWDLSHVLGLVHSLSLDPASSPPDHLRRGLDASESPRHPTEAIQHGADIDRRDFVFPSPTLGDFSRVFQYLGTPVSTPPPTLRTAPAQDGPAPVLSSWEQYASDGATYARPGSSRSKTVQWADEPSADDTLAETVSDASVGSESRTLTKQQRKKLRRKERRAREGDTRTLATRLAAGNAASESEAEFATLSTPAKKASAHTINPSWNRAGGSKKDQSSTPTLVHDHGHIVNGQALAETPSTSDKAGETADVSDLNGTIATQTRTEGNVQDENLHIRHSETPLKSATRFYPSSVKPPPATSTAQQEPHGSRNIKASSTSKLPHAIEPLLVRTGEDRNWTLLMKLISDFWMDRSHLISPMNLTTHNNSPTGIHVFVDASNIFIGFNEQLKRSRNIPTWVRTPAVGLSFDALALLMERRRPVAKRVLVGSTPHLPAFDKAKAVGYECSILEKVYKARELTERQIYFKDIDEQRGSTAGTAGKRTKVPPPANLVASTQGQNYGGSSNNGGSGSETGAPQFAPPRLIEQGVDEILHLKILESVVDADAPSTMVLATGDAAQAEYSQGFMAMAERALRKGWRVELVSWSANISAMYRRRDWAQAWGDRFRVITLDDYAEELLDM